MLKESWLTCVKHTTLKFPCCMYYLPPYPHKKAYFKFIWTKNVTLASTNISKTDKVGI